MGRPIAPEDLSDLIGAIYDCALDPGLWETAIGRIREAVHAYNAVLALHALPSGRIMLAASSNVDAARLAALDGYAADVIDQWGGPEAWARQSLTEPAVLSWVRPRRDWEDNRYYAEWARPQGIDDVYGFLVARDAGAVGSLGLARHESAGPVTQAEFDLLALILPHVQRAVQVSRILDVKTIAVRTFEAALDSVSSGVVLVDQDLRIVHANAAAERLLAAGYPIAVASEVLTVGSRQAQQALADAVALADSDEARLGRRGFGIPVRSDGAVPAALYVLPLARGSRRAASIEGVVAAVFVAPANAPRPAPEQALAALFDLTPAEARVFARMAEGDTVAEVSLMLGASEGTVRTHLHRIFEKTGTRRQVELVKLATSLATLA
jgi:DNA-binding CsgD family transcriptional regulator/PAS domain-containing protein